MGRGASEEDLAGVTGIGPVFAHRIVEFRRVNGRFVSPRELRYIEGLAPAALDALSPALRV